MSSPSPSTDAGRVRFRKLRIAWSVAWSVLAVLLIVLWVRSYWWLDSVSHVSRPATQVIFQSYRGTVGVCSMTIPAIYYDLIHPGWDSNAELIGKNTTFLNAQVGETLPSTLGFRWRQTNCNFVASVPDLFLVISFATFVAAPWLHWRFSLRTLVIATALLAVILGTIVYAAK